MELLKAMLKRRSIRKYKNEKIPDEKLDKILKSGLLAPTSRNRQPCEFIVIKNKELIEKLANSKEHGSQFLKNSNTTILVIADTEKADTWIEDSSIALSFMHLTATSENIGSCWCQIHLRKRKSGEDSEEYIKKILKLDEKYRIVGILGLGISDENPKPKEFKDLDLSKIKYI